MKNHFLLAVAIVVTTPAAWASNEVFSCTLNYNHTGEQIYPQLSTYIEEDSPTRALYSHIIFKETDASKERIGTNERLLYVYGNNQHQFSGTNYTLTIDASQAGSECGNWWAPNCQGKVEFKLEDESVARSAKVLCHTQYR